MNKQYFAESNTDKIIRERYFSDFTYVGIMVEVGGATPEYLSMSKHFKLNGWRTIIIEPNPKFVELHRMQGNEVYEYACSDSDQDNVPFQVVNWLGNTDYDSLEITDHSFSALSVKEGYLKKHNYTSIDSLPHTEICVQVRRLDTILKQINVDRIDLLSIDVEGWELEVLQGFSINQFQPKVIVLENYLHDDQYTEFMGRFNYQLDDRIEHNYIYTKALGSRDTMETVSAMFVGAGSVNTSELDEFVAKCDELGGPWHPNAANYLSNFSLKFKTNVDQSLDPFSNEYYQSQVELYEEISGRTLNQKDGEQFTFDLEKSVLGANPYNSIDVNFVSRNVRAVSTALNMANIPAGGKVLDMGSGWGLSSEIFAFCCANVTCVDINHLFIELNKKRAARLDLPINARLSEFDTYEDQEMYDLIFFYECLHHSRKPWETLRHIAKILSPNGKIAFAGEPVTDMFWQNWGVRLDSLSVYCIRKYGWFESGWSESFISRAFEHAGLKLYMYPDVGLDNGIIGIATKMSNDVDPSMSFNLHVTVPCSSLIHKQHHSLSQQHHSLSQKHHSLSQQYHSLSQKHHSLSQQYHSLSQKHHSLVNSRLLKSIRKTIGFFKKISFLR